MKSVKVQGEEEVNIYLMKAWMWSRIMETDLRTVQGGPSEELRAGWYVKRGRRIAVEAVI